MQRTAIARLKVLNLCQLNGISLAAIYRLKLARLWARESVDDMTQRLGHHKANYVHNQLI